VPAANPETAGSSLQHRCDSVSSPPACHPPASRALQSFRNFPVAGVMDQLVTNNYSPLSSLLPMTNPFTGLPSSYSWWLVIFQLTTLLFTTVAVAKAPGLQRMAVPLLTVLTTRRAPGMGGGGMGGELTRAVARPASFSSPVRSSTRRWASTQ